MTQEIRWHHRFDNFSRAYTRLKEGLDIGIEALSPLARDGVIQRFKYTFELAWNVMKDWLQYDGVAMDSVAPRNVIRTAAAAGLIDDGQTWMDMLEDRRNTSHAYNSEILETVLHNIRENYMEAIDNFHQRFLAEVSDESSTAPENS